MSPERKSAGPAPEGEKRISPLQRCLAIAAIGAVSYLGQDKEVVSFYIDSSSQTNGIERRIEAQEDETRETIRKIYEALVRQDAKFLVSITASDGLWWGRFNTPSSEWSRYPHPLGAEYAWARSLASGNASCVGYLPNNDELRLAVSGLEPLTYYPAGVFPSGFAEVDLNRQPDGWEISQVSEISQADYNSQWKSVFANWLPCPQPNIDIPAIREGIQEDIEAKREETRDFVRQIHRALEEKDIDFFLSFVRENRLRWGFYQTDLLVSYRGNEMRERLTEAFSSGGVSCLGFSYSENPFGYKILEILTSGLSIFPESNDLAVLVFTSESGEELWLKSIGEVEAARAHLFTPDFASWEPCPEIEAPGRTRVITFTGLTGTVSGEEPNPVYAQLGESLLGLGFEEKDIIPYSYGGGFWDEAGNYHPEDQECQDTLTSPEGRAKKLVDFLLEWLKRHPNDQLKIVSHSESAQVVIMAVEEIKLRAQRGQPFPDPAKLEFIITHGPIRGLDLNALWYLAALLPWIPENCDVFGQPLPRLPNPPAPGTLLTPAGQNLREAWLNREIRLPQIREAIRWFRAGGGEIAAVGVWGDPALHFRFAILPRALIQRWIELGTIPEIMLSQTLPGPENQDRNHMLFLGVSHDAILRDGLGREAGLEIVLELIGRQETSLQAAAKSAVRLQKEGVV